MYMSCVEKWRDWRMLTMHQKKQKDGPPPGAVLLVPWGLPNIW